MTLSLSLVIATITDSLEERLAILIVAVTDSPTAKLDSVNEEIVNAGLAELLELLLPPEQALSIVLRINRNNENKCLYCLSKLVWIILFVHIFN